MLPFGICSAWLFLASPAVVEPDELEFPHRKFVIPFMLPPGTQRPIQSIRLYVSEDRGKTWKIADERPRTVDRFSFAATHDGHYWFAVQTIEANGKRNPVRTTDLTPALKVYLNESGRPLMRRPAPPPVQP